MITKADLHNKLHGYTQSLRFCMLFSQDVIATKDIVNKPRDCLHSPYDLARIVIRLILSIDECKTEEMVEYFIKIVDGTEHTDLIQELIWSLEDDPQNENLVKKLEQKQLKPDKTAEEKTA